VLAGRGRRFDDLGHLLHDFRILTCDICCFADTLQQIEKLNIAVDAESNGLPLSQSHCLIVAFSAVSVVPVQNSTGLVNRAVF
jgi:hypothetical protein